MSTLQFPASPSPGQSFTAENGVTYTYDPTGGGGWTATNPIGIDDEYVNIDGDNMTGDLTLGTDKIKLAADGGASFAKSAAQIRGTDGMIYWDQPTGFIALYGQRSGTGTFAVTSDGEIRLGGVDPSDAGQTNILLKGLDGSATFAGEIAYVNPSAGSKLNVFGIYNSGTGAKTVPTFQIESFGTTRIGGTLPDAANITLNADGSARFAGVGTFGDSPSTSTTNSGVVINSFRDGTTGWINAYQGGLQLYNNTNDPAVLTAEIVANTGSAKFKSAVFADQSTFGELGNLYVYRDTDGITNTLIQGGSALGPQVFNVTADGTITAKGSNLNFINLRLEGDDDTKYTSTTDVDGNETLVYNGATLDVKEVGLALVALKAAAANATDFTSLKSAIATSLANL